LGALVTRKKQGLQKAVPEKGEDKGKNMNIKDFEKVKD